MKKAKHGLTPRGREALQGYGFIGIWIVSFFLFVLYPVIYSMILSVNAIKIRPEGIEYTFKQLFFYDYALNELPHFRNCLAVQLKMVCGMTPVILVLSLIIAMLLNGKFRGRALFRAIFFVPVIIMSGPVVSSLLTQQPLDFSADSWIIYDLLDYLPSALSSPVKYVLDNFVQILWMCGVQILIFLAGLQSIGTEVYEAASIDGAGAWEKFWQITLPHISPMILICAVYTVIDTANYNEGGNMNALINSQIFDANYMYSYAAAMSWMYFVVIALVLVLVLLIFKFFGRKGKAKS